MAFCGKCGTQVADGQAFCPNCGNAMQGAATPQQPVTYNAPQQPMNAGTDAQNNKVMAILAYFGILVLVPIFAAKDSPFARYHANQGLVLAIALAAYAIINSILLGIFGAIMLTSTSGFAIYGVISVILGLVYILFGILAILGIINAAKGEMKPLPIIGKITILK